MKSRKVNEPHKEVLVSWRWLSCITWKLLLLCKLSSFLTKENVNPSIICLVSQPHASSHLTRGRLFLHALLFEEKTTMMDLHQLDWMNAQRFAFINRAFKVKGQSNNLSQVQVTCIYHELRGYFIKLNLLFNIISSIWHWWFTAFNQIPIARKVSHHHICINKNI